MALKFEVIQQGSGLYYIMVEKDYFLKYNFAKLVEYISDWTVEEWAHHVCSTFNANQDVRRDVVIVSFFTEKDAKAATLELNKLLKKHKYVQIKTDFGYKLEGGK